MTYDIASRGGPRVEDHFASRVRAQRPAAGSVGRRAPEPEPVAAPEPPAEPAPPVVHPEPAEVRAAAHAALARGWAVHPVHTVTGYGICTCPKRSACPKPGKHPVDTDWQKGPAMTAEQIDAAWPDGRRPHNLGVRTGVASGLLVLDEDRPGALDELAVTLDGGLEETREHRSTSGGVHLIYVTTDPTITNSRRNLPQGIDVRGNGGQVVIAPSVTGAGSYGVLRDVEPVPAPAALLERLRPTPAPEPRLAPATPSAPGSRDRYAVAAWAAEIARLDAMRAAATPGGHGYSGEAWDATTYAVACTGFDLADSPWCSLTREQVEADVLAHAPADDGFDRSSVAAKIESARRKVTGHGRPEPAADWLATSPPPPGGSVAVREPEPPPEPAEVPSEPSTSSRPHLRERALSISGLAGLPPVEALIAGLLYRATLAQLSGAPGEYKTFIALAMALSVATGRSFEGYAVPRGGPVVYIAAEGSTGLLARVMAWCHLTGVNPTDLDGKFFVVPEPVQLGNSIDVAEAVEFAAEIGAALVVLDTRARCTLGLEENSATEQGTAIHSAERIQRASGATVLVVHHAGRSGDHGRGSTAWDGAVWSDLRVSGADLRASLHCAKHKDVRDGCRHEFEMKPVTVPAALMPGAPETARQSLVSVQGGLWTPPAADGKNARIVQKIVWTAAPPEGLAPGVLRDLAMEAGASRTGAYAAINGLVTGGFLRNVGTHKAPRYVTDQPAPADTEAAL